jgi:transposase-like protein
LLTVRWYLKYSLSYRDLVEMMEERGLQLAHTTIMRWVHEFGPELEKRIRPYLKPTNDSFRTDETYIKAKGQWNYLYRAVNSNGNRIDFMLSENRDAPAAKRFFKKVLTFITQSITTRDRCRQKPSVPCRSPAIEGRESYESRNNTPTTEISQQYY